MRWAAAAPRASFPVPSEERGRLSLNDDEVLTLARWAA